MKDVLALLGKGKIFTKPDLQEAYYRVRIKEGDEWKTAFNCPLGCFQFQVLSFELQEAPAVFMQLINEVLHEHLYKGVLVYLDDIVIYSESMDDHVKLVRTVLKKLRAAELYAKLSKCEFHQSKIDDLGYRISHEGIEMDPGKVRTVLEWAAPRTRKQLQSFLGFANFYRQFIPSFAKITLPITNLLKTKGEVKPNPSRALEWTMDCQAAFEKLKRLFAAEPILKHPDMEEPFVVQADTSDVAVGAVLLQKNAEGKLQPCAYTSRKLSETERRWAIWEKEAFAVQWALLTWRQFLEGAKHPFEVWTDHKNLEALKTPCKLSPKQVRWAQHFNHFNFTLCYLPGGKNFMADALSRLPQYNSTKEEVVRPIIPVTQLAAPVTTRAQMRADPALSGDLLHKLQEALKTDEWFRTHSNECTLCDGLAWIGAKLYVPASLRVTVLQHAHDAKTAGHFGFVKTVHLIKRQFWWPALKKDIEAYVASCPVCASAKRPPGKPPGLLQSVARPNAPWKEISMDLIVDVPESGGCTVIWAVTDLFSKQVHFIPCSKIPSAKTLAKLFIQHVYRLHGAPKGIISDRGVQFTSNFWKEFLGLIGVKLRPPPPDKWGL
ncbi:queuine tRNA-ribosyltransferase catalytic subunit 1 isoform X1 [Pantherophis guttatus]|uniref:Gypsy retrotransposon integrase-like protein 1 n=1 Tax=Pantherophis guttatus TaxID=94885 RepID=A0ABM3YTB1_PANGU|nr:queuine tRNA-ribosyltransferase catalytic subunit 1 isoform X1 [Pantherophis guttatus]